MKKFSQAPTRHEQISEVMGIHFSAAETHMLRLLNGSEVVDDPIPQHLLVGKPISENNSHKKEILNAAKNEFGFELTCRVSHMIYTPPLTKTSNF